ncbi:MAG TPA: ABC transporter ATP-binding protein [Elusimicrobia bacterium]|nr:ABC transporter ATP-binding protein [Elusimicrobiota bacterium]HBT61762.1 ABC transporter ATP-binding protein [Elusimicrobiota bacterium]
MPDAPALEFSAVTKTYFRSHLGRTTQSRGILDLTLKVADGESFGLLGLNGSGKTTSFKLALGLLRPTSGEVRVLGRQPADAVALAHVGFLPELPYFYPFLTPQEALRFYGRLSGLPEAELGERIVRTLEIVGLSVHAGRRMAEFSKGMVQRVGLAQAILHDPRLVILDEPVSGLDPLAIKEFRDLLGRLRGQGKTLVVSSHSISELEKLCDRVGILKEGRLERSIAHQEWEASPDGLEGLFVETVR